MTLYRERLLPGPMIFVIAALLIPASLLVFLPINQTVGVFCAAILYLAAVVWLVLVSPVIEVTDTAFVAGRARLPLEDIGETAGFEGSGAEEQRMLKLDARAWLVLRGWIKPVVKVEVVDEQDPTPYWLVSTRHPEAVVRAVAEARARTTARDAAQD